MRILLYDVESMGERGWYFPPRYDTNILHVDHTQHLLSVAWKWLGEKKVSVMGLDDYHYYKNSRHNDRELISLIKGLFSEADVVIAHNGDSFDQKMVNARLMFHRMSPPEPYRQIDTKKVAKKYGRFASNKLDDLGRQLELGQKLSHGNFAELWLAADNGDRQAWKVMKRYNKQDVVLLEQLYLELRPWIDNHPSVSLMTNIPNGCPKCGHQDMQRRGYGFSKVAKYQRYQCVNCGGWSRIRLTESTGVHYVN